MTWNYRVVKRMHPDYPDEPSLAIHSVYYEEGLPTAVSAKPSYPSGADLDELKRDIERYVRAIDEPTLDYDSFSHQAKAPE